MPRAQRKGAALAGLRPMRQGEPLLQSARCARRDLGDRARLLYRPRAGAGQILLRGLARGRGRLMPDLLLELLTEEIPARMQGAAARELKRLAGVAFDAAGLKAASIESHVTPRRLTLAVIGLPKAQAATEEERRGPRVGAPLFLCRGLRLG